jgi:hypothetical protein
VSYKLLFYLLMPSTFSVFSATHLRIYVPPSYCRRQSRPLRRDEAATDSWIQQHLCAFLLYSKALSLVYHLPTRPKAPRRIDLHLQKEGEEPNPGQMPWNLLAATLPSSQKAALSSMLVAHSLHCIF